MSKQLPELLRQSNSLRTIAFIDAGQFRPGVITNRLGLFPGQRFDWDMFKKFLDRVAGGPLLDAHYFDSYEEQTVDRRFGFHQFLHNQLGFQLHLTPLKERQKRCPCCSSTFSESEQKGVDVGIAVSMFKLARAYDQALLCSGDGDFAKLAEFLRDSLGKRVIVLGVQGSLAQTLVEAAFSTITLNDYSEDFIGQRYGQDQEQQEENEKMEGEKQ